MISHCCLVLRTEWHALVVSSVFGIAHMTGIQLFAFMMVYSICYILQAHFFGFSCLEEGEPAALLFVQEGVRR